jgi:hypothetical protein
MFTKYQFDPAVATALKSADKAFIIEYMLWSIKDKEKHPDRYKHLLYQGEYYTYDTYKHWAVRMPWVSERSVRRYMNELRKDGWIKSMQLSSDRRNRTYYSTVNTELYEKTSAGLCILHVSKLDTSHVSKLDTCKGPDGPHASLYKTKTHTKTHTKTPKNKTDKPGLSAPRKKSGIAIPQKWLTQITPFDRRVSENWFNWAKTECPHGKFKMDQFTLALTKMRVNFSLNENQINFILEFVQKDEFWGKNAISPASLLKASKSMPDITKLEQVINSLKHRKKSSSEKAIETAMKVSAEIDGPITVGGIEIPEDAFKFLEEK